MDGQSSWWVTLVGGWLLGLFSPHITGFFTRWHRRRKLKQALLVELSEFRVKMAAIAWNLLAKTGQLDYDFARWYVPVISESKDIFRGEPIKYVANELAKKNESETKQYIDVVVAASQGRGPALNLLKYEIPFLEAKVASFELFDTYFQRMLFKVRWHVGLLNGKIATAETLKWKLIDQPGDAPLKNALWIEYESIAAQAREIADVISQIQKHDGC